MVLTLPLLMSMIAGAIGAHAWVLPPLWQLTLAAPVQIIAGATFYAGAWRALKAVTGTMDTLVTLGTTAAFVTSLAAMLGDGGALHFGGAAAVITFVLVGKTLETRAVRGAGDAVRGLVALTPRTAVRLAADGSEHSIDTAALAVGDVVRVRAGQRIPGDGTVVTGSGDVDEAHLTGESLARGVGPGDAVLGGALAGLGALDVRMTALGADSRLGETIAALTAARAGKSSIQHQADRVAQVFVPAVVAVAAITVLAWGFAGAGWVAGVEAAAAVLVVSCPCALGLAAPTAIAAGVSRAAREGLLVRRADAFEALASVSTLIFDKTGTLTLGRPTVASLKPADGITDTDLLGVAAAVAGGANHPLARAIADAGNARGLGPPDAQAFLTEPGFGMTATVDGRQAAVGNARLIRDRAGLAVPDTSDIGTHAWVARADGQGQGWCLMGRIDFSDTVHPSTPGALDRARTMGLGVHVLSGDTDAACRSALAGLSVDGIEAGLTPAEKAAAVRALRNGGCVAMVGDGVNDAPALTAADVGLAMGSGTDIAANAGSVVLAGNDPGQAVAAIALARAVRRTVRQNLFWAFVYNTAAIPAAALGLLTPAVAGAAMALSSLCVVTNALALGARRETEGRTA